MMDRAFALLTLKADGDERRELSGIATSPTPDRVEDVIEPQGVMSAGDLPLCLHHDTRLVVGRAKLGQPTKRGVPFTARLPKVSEPGRLQERVDEAWHLLKYGLITAVSIGFRAIRGQTESIAGGGVRYKAIEVLELSLVPVPAQREATIDQVRSAFRRGQQDTQQPHRPIVRLDQPTARRGVIFLDTPARKSGVMYVERARLVVRLDGSPMVPRPNGGTIDLAALHLLRGGW